MTNKLRRFFFTVLALLGTFVIATAIRFPSPAQTILTGGGYIGPTTQTNYGITRAVDGTAYQNTGTTPRTVTISLRCASGAGEFYGMTNSTNSLVSPTNLVMLTAVPSGAGGWETGSFTVLPGWYYSVTQDGCTPDSSLRFWTEWQ